MSSPSAELFREFDPAAAASPPDPKRPSRVELDHLIGYMWPTDSVRRLQWTEEDYFRLEADSPHKHEFLAGEIFAMAGAKASHNLVAANVIGALGARLRGKPCKVFTSDQRIHIPATGLYTYPDGGVACGTWSIHDADGMSLLNPALLVEVLSPATEAYDRGAKLTHYLKIRSLQEVLIVAQPERRVEHHLRSASGTFSSRDQRAGVLELALGVCIPIDELYDQIEAALG